jgi:hypothetical protein
MMLDIGGWMLEVGKYAANHSHPTSSLQHLTSIHYENGIGVRIRMKITIVA